MVLEDVANRARLLVVSGAALDSQRLGDGDLNVVDELPVPDRLEDPVRKAEGEHVLHGLLPEVVVDTEDLSLLEELFDRLLQHACGREIVAKRLLDDEPHPPLRRPPFADGSDNRLEGGRRRREVEDAVALRPALFVELGQRLGEHVLALLVGKVHRDVAHATCQQLPDVVAEFVA